MSQALKRKLVTGRNTSSFILLDSCTCANQGTTNGTSILMSEKSNVSEIFAKNNFFCAILTGCL